MSNYYWNFGAVTIGWLGRDAFVITRYCWINRRRGKHV